MSRRGSHGWLVEGLLNLAAFLSLVVGVAGFLTKVPVWTGIGVTVGTVGVVCGFVLLGRRVAPHTALSAALAILAIDLTVLVLMWTTT